VVTEGELVAGRAARDNVVHQLDRMGGALDWLRQAADSGRTHPPSSEPSDLYVPPPVHTSRTVHCGFNSAAGRRIDCSGRVNPEPSRCSAGRRRLQRGSGDGQRGAAAADCHSARFSARWVSPMRTSASTWPQPVRCLRENLFGAFSSLAGCSALVSRAPGEGQRPLACALATTSAVAQGAAPVTLAGRSTGARADPNADAPRAVAGCSCAPGS